MEQTSSLQERKTRESRRRPEDATFKSAQFPPRLEGPSRILPPLWLISGNSPPVWRCPPVNHNRHGARPLKGRSVEFAFLPASVCLCFSKIKAHALKKNKKQKKTVQFPRWRKPFHNFKYNNFLSGMMPGIIHMYLAFIYGFLFPP